MRLNNAYMQGLTLVVSPLISLMKDQVDALVSKGVRAASLDSTSDRGRLSWIKSEVLAEKMKILYVAPERYAVRILSDSVAENKLGSTTRALST
jgi:superfamily II DNA helicase RecQ